MRLFIGVVVATVFSAFNIVDRSKKKIYTIFKNVFVDTLILHVGVVTAVSDIMAFTAITGVTPRRPLQLLKPSLLLRLRIEQSARVFFGVL